MLFLPHEWLLFRVSRLQINPTGTPLVSGAQSGYTSWLTLNIILKFSCYLSFSKLVFPITSFFLMNAMDQQWLYFTLHKAVQKHLQSDTKQRISIIILTWFARALKVLEFQNKNSRPWKSLKIAVGAGKSLNFNANFIVSVELQRKKANTERPSG